MSTTLYPSIAPIRPTLGKAIYAYPYEEYNDDEAMLAYFSALNALTQSYVDWFQNIDLPNYTKQAGALLDWVAEGLYDHRRGLLPTGAPRLTGGFNTTRFNRIHFNGFTRVDPVDYFIETDDLFKRIMTWNLFKGDGKQFTVRWLKRRVMRFLTGTNGVDPIVSGTWQISVAFLPGKRCLINIYRTLRTIRGGALFNESRFNRLRFNQMISRAIVFPAIPLAPILAAAISVGACELPFEYTYIVQVEGSTISDLYVVSNVLHVLPESGYVTSATGLPPGAVWRDPVTNNVRIVSGVTPDPLAPPIYFPGVTATQLAAFGGGNLPHSAGTAGSGLLWNNAGTVNVS